jgi:prepilin-type N-terminal cleavage/methylation domain-containing protein
MKRRSGFSLIELLIALAILGLVAGTLTRLLVSAHRSFRQQTERADFDGLLRQAAALFHAEFRGLDSGDSTGSDFESIGPQSIGYKPVRTFRFLCRRPDTLDATLTAWAPYFGVRDLRPDLDSVLVLSAGYSEEFWESADLLAVEPASCPGGFPGLLARVAGISASRLAAIPEGAPLLGRESVQIQSYRDGRGEWWIGMRRYQKLAGRWPAIQPVLGPLTPGGFQVSYHDESGSLVTNHTDVAGIRVRISLRNADPFAVWKDRESTIEAALRGRGGG